MYARWGWVLGASYDLIEARECRGFFEAVRGSPSAKRKALLAKRGLQLNGPV